ncbi:hypothetical protein PM02_18595 [Sulfitobacter mediterraneus]|uniref:Uncharacterized protein n=1 Tax=Sulfitobacter mediterraneus TaxID=83219 RepID=A0A061SPK4_9RHOB|nr:hypothetical protein PM02_18595 [Sulfitobacter mediterraneus]
MGLIGKTCIHCNRRQRRVFLCQRDLMQPVNRRVKRQRLARLPAPAFDPPLHRPQTAPRPGQRSAVHQGTRPARQPRAARPAARRRARLRPLCHQCRAKLRPSSIRRHALRVALKCRLKKPWHRPALRRLRQPVPSVREQSDRNRINRSGAPTGGRAILGRRQGQPVHLGQMPGRCHITPFGQNA